jgi:hypothetical protein
MNPVNPELHRRCIAPHDDIDAYAARWHAQMLACNEVGGGAKEFAPISEVVRREFTTERMLENYLTLYRRVLG